MCRASIEGCVTCVASEPAICLIPKNASHPQCKQRLQNFTSVFLLVLLPVADSCQQQTGICTWDTAVADRQAGCYIQPGRQLQLQQQCIQPKYQQPLEPLQQCMLAETSCQCSGSTSSSCSAADMLHAADVAAAAAGGANGSTTLSTTGEASSAVCPSQLSCWMGGLQKQEGGIYLGQLVEVQLVQVLPQLQALWMDSSSPMPLLRAADISAATTAATPVAAGGSSGRRHKRRSLLGIPIMGGPVKEEGNAAQNDKMESAPVVCLKNCDGLPEGVAPPTSILLTGGLGQNIPITPEGQLPGTNIPTVERDSSVGSYKPVFKPEAGTMPQTTNMSVPPGGSSGSGSPAPVGPVAPVTFWNCVKEAKADSTSKWADVDYNNKQLTLEAVLRVVQPVVSW